MKIKDHKKMSDIPFQNNRDAKSISAKNQLFSLFGNIQMAKYLNMCDKRTAKSLSLNTRDSVAHKSQTCCCLALLPMNITKYNIQK